MIRGGREGVLRYGINRRAHLERTWAGPFRRDILPLIDEDPFEHFYCRDNGRPNTLLSPKEDPWSSLVQSLDLFTEDFMEHRNQPGLDERESL
ncbi:MAG: antitoxin [Desulfatibacillaceae bacterium]